MKHIIYNKNFYGCTEIEDSSVQFIFADPPYNISKNEIFNNTEIGYKPNKGDWDIISKETEIENAFNLIKDSKRILNETGTIAISGVYGSLIPYFNFLNEFGFHFKHHLIWHKNNPAPCVHRRSMTLSNEIILIYSKNKKYKFNYEISKSFNNGKQLHDVWDIPVVRKKLEVTRKPPELLKRLISIYSDSEDLISDTFIGSGTTYEVSEQLNRNFIGYEICKKRGLQLIENGFNVK